MQSQCTTTETSPIEWMGATLGCFLSENMGYSSRNTGFYSFFVYLPEGMLWRTDICFLISRGDSRELCPSFTRGACKPLCRWFFSVGRKSLRPSSARLLIAARVKALLAQTSHVGVVLRCRAWTNTWETFHQTRPQSTSDTAPGRPNGAAPLVGPNPTERNRTAGLPGLRSASSRSAGRAGSRPTDFPSSQSKAELPS